LFFAQKKFPLAILLSFESKASNDALRGFYTASRVAKKMRKAASS
jgi:hypothetical protein